MRLLNGSSGMEPHSVRVYKITNTIPRMSKIRDQKQLSHSGAPQDDRLHLSRIMQQLEQDARQLQSEKAYKHM